MIPIGDLEKLKRTPWMNFLLVAVNIGVFVYVYFFSDAPVHLIERFGFVPARFFSGGWNPLHYWPKYISLVTSVFLHGDYLHIIGNMLFMLTFGDNVEDKLGPWRYLFFFLLCGIVGNLTHAYAFPESWRVLIGASGAIAGVMGAFYIILPKEKIRSWFIFFTKEIPAVYYIFIWFLFNLARGILHLEGMYREPTAWWAHIGGFIAGALIINLFLHGAPQVKMKVKTGGKPKR